MSRPRQFVALVVLCGTVALAGGGAARLGVFGSTGIENTSTPIGDRGATRGAASLSDVGEPIDTPLASAMGSVVAVAGSHLTLPEPAVAPAAMSVGKAAMTDPDPAEAAGFSAAEEPFFEASLADSRPPPPETRVQLASLSTSDPMKEYPKPAVRPVETPNECLVAEICIDEYLWSLYERTPKVDTNKVTEQIKETVKKKSKTRTITKTITKYVTADFTWKDPIAAQRAGMSLKDCVIGGVDRGFKPKLYRSSRHGRRRAHARDHERIPRRLPTIEPRSVSAATSESAVTASAREYEIKTPRPSAGSSTSAMRRSFHYCGRITADITGEHHGEWHPSEHIWAIGVL